jgi:branched-chain amino acid transport system substrate-binding protein
MYLFQDLSRPTRRQFVLLSLSVLFVASSCGRVGQRSKPEAVKIGAVLPLTGSGAVWGQNAQKGMKIAVDEVNRNGGINGRSIEIVYEDSQTDPAKAVTAFRKLIDLYKPRVIIGDIASSNVLAMAPIAEEEKVILLSPGASNPKISDAGDYIFRNWQSDALEGRLDAEFAWNTLGWKTAAILSVENAYGEGLRDGFAARFKELGGKLAVSDSYRQGSSDFRAMLQRVDSTEPDGIFFPSYPEEMPEILRQAHSLGLKRPWLSVQAFSDPQVIAAAGKAAEGVMYSKPTPPDPSDPAVKSFTQEYKDRHRVDPGVCSDTGYDAVMIVADVLRKTGPEAPPENVQREMARVKDFAGATGRTTFDEKGDVYRELSFYRITDGKPVLIEK